MREETALKQISILGSTGSIGTQTLDVARGCREELSIAALAAGKNIELLEKQAREFQPKLVSVFEEKEALELKKRLKDTAIEVACGMEGLIAAACLPEADIVVGAVVGMIGILPTVEAIKAGKDIAIANKETLVTAGHKIMPLAKEKGVRLLPVDSEHSAIFQALHGEEARSVEKILLTASGGPFRGRTRKELEQVRVEDALKHPNWSMGRKITIDSSTMVNKGLEVIEAKWLFDVEFDQIQVVVQPQSVIHSMVQFQDGAVMAQLGTPDMRLPIQYAMFYPERRPLLGERLDFTALSHLDFEAPDMESFPGLFLGYQAGREGGSMPTVYNAANEWAVARFLDQGIRYTEIAEIISWAMEGHRTVSDPDIEEIIAIGLETCQCLERKWGTKSL